MIFDSTPGASSSPVILHVPHASREITPEARAGLPADDAAVAEELDHLTDAHTDVIARRAAQAAAIRPWIFENRWSRLVVDPERFPDDREEMRAVGMGAVYTKDLSRALRFADGLDTGWVNVNESTNYWEAHLPFGGRAGKKSGIGRVGGRFALEQMTDLKTIVIEISPE